MNYTALRLSCSDEEQSEILMAELADFPFESFETDDGRLTAYIRQEALAACRSEVEAVLARYGASGKFETIANENWNAVWERDFQPVDVEGRLLIRAPFHDPAPDSTIEVVLLPQMSFGTGHHATTWMMTRELFEIPLAGRCGLDLGCGTGVLAIAALRLGATRVDAVDVDDRAVASSADNAIRNGVADRMETLCGDVRCVADRHYDFILANIHRNILLEVLPTCFTLLNPGGVLLMSGFYEEDVPALVEAATATGFRHAATRARENWRMIRVEKASV